MADDRSQGGMTAHEEQDKGVVLFDSVSASGRRRRPVRTPCHGSFPPPARRFAANRGRSCGGRLPGSARRVDSPGRRPAAIATPRRPGPPARHPRPRRSHGSRGRPRRAPGARDRAADARCRPAVSGVTAGLRAARSLPAALRSACSWAPRRGPARQTHRRRSHRHARDSPLLRSTIRRGTLWIPGIPRP